MVIWKPKDLDSFQDLKSHVESKGLALPPLLLEILSSKNVSVSELENFLNPQLSSLKNPFSILNMDKASQRLIKAYKENEKICIYADFDLDGSSGLGLLKQGLELIGFKNIHYYQPKRLTEGYGFHVHAVEELKLQGINLIVTVDVGITSHAAVKKAQSLNIDVILTDHHLPTEVLPEAFCILNPNQKSCPSGLGYLSGAGVAFYLCRALKRAFFDDPDLPHENWDLKDLLDLFCIATLTDMVPLVDDNRILVKSGLLSLQKTKKPGLQALLESLDLWDRPLTSQDVAIRFAPKLNALSRMESEILPIDIYLQTNLFEARGQVERILQNNSTRQHLQSFGESKSNEILKDWTYADFIFVESVDFHRGIIGLIATKLANDHQKPAFVGSQNSEGLTVGSCRVPAGSDINLVEALSSAGSYLNRFGGHSAAAGFEYHFNNKSFLIDRLNNYFVTLKTFEKKTEIIYDVEAKLSHLTDSFMKWYDHISPFGVGMTTPLLYFREISLKKLSELRGGHLKLQLVQTDENQVDYFCDALVFSPSEKTKIQLKNIESSKGEIQFDILGEVQKNYFRQRESIQILVKDLRFKEI